MQALEPPVAAREVPRTTCAPEDASLLPIWTSAAAGARASGLAGLIAVGLNTGTMNVGNMDLVAFCMAYAASAMR